MSKADATRWGQIDGESRGPPTRLRDLISGMQLQQADCVDLIARIDPPIADMLHALAAHRQIKIEDFVADALMRFALDTADAAWKIGVRQHARHNNDPEAALLGKFLEQAIRLRLSAETMIASAAPVDRAPVRPQRVGYPYAPE